MGSGWIVALTGTAVGIVLVCAVSFYIYYGRLYMRARVANATVSFGRMMRLSASGQSAHRIVSAYIEARRAGITISLDDLEALVRAGKDPRSAVRDLFELRSNSETGGFIEKTKSWTKNPTDVDDKPPVIR